MAAHGEREVFVRIADWSRRFQSGDMTVEEVHESFAALTSEQLDGLTADASRALTQAIQELDAIHFGMCQSGQAGEISRILRELSSLPTHGRSPRKLRGTWGT